ncbi:peptide chain release factor N(5)-glutamine methyltransferase [Sphingobacterium sp. lm-10]|uniref:peptide chain release factor N(5)-glutamine methyltransferase n=1 Tax=Sphingobacterium sp. lm-10 TaxID=2944904 RepID=UPI00202043F1|nr:peptide chain release factor N(5)-glutamine methyltransferase [Sphingobacterium sp. lm-10]MCL7987381.1 peptide chain release factor N(5)-glutamine methyltransferase [Sphingobacterium sp. lm-10]
MQTLHTFRIEFHKELHAYYPAEEIDSLFYIVVDEILSISRLKAQVDLQQEVNNSFIGRMNDVMDSLRKQIPIQHILGHAPFYGFDFEVNEHTLIPRPETEELVHLLIHQEKDRKCPHILDIGTGSGCIAISLAKLISTASVEGMDISSEALAVAKRNATKLNAQVCFTTVDILDWRNFESKKATYDVIVSNPPYITPAEKKEMSVQVLDHEPHGALFVKETDPLIFYREIAAFAAVHLSQGGALYFEINQYLAEETKNVVQAQGFSKVIILDDINGAKRMLFCLR